MERRMTKAPQRFMLNVANDTKLDSGGRAVMFPVAKTRKGSVIFATCAHAVENHSGRIQMTVFDHNGENLEYAGNTQNWIIPPSIGADLVFIDMPVSDMSQFQPVRLQKDRISTGKELTYTRNVMYKKDFPEQILLTETKKAHLIKTEIYARSSKGFDTLSAGYNSMGRNYPIRGLWMRSYPGVSGSPLYDNFGRVYGMVCGGNNSLDIKYNDYFLVYLPSKLIKKYLKDFMGDKII